MCGSVPKMDELPQFHFTVIRKYPKDSAQDNKRRFGDEPGEILELYSDSKGK
jgi:hypothetical protein